MHHHAMFIYVYQTQGLVYVLEAVFQLSYIQAQGSISVILYFPQRVK